MAPDVHAVEIVGLVKSYGEVQAVRGIDLDVSPGEVVGFLGPNGAGKSTTIRCLLDLLRPTSGSVRLFGLESREHGVEARRRVAYVPGELRLPEHLTADEFLDRIAGARGVTTEHRASVIERLGLDPSRPMRGLSTGNRRKVALAAAFMAPTELLILDEPTSGLDPLVQETFRELVAEAAARGSGVLLSSHVLAEVQRTASRVVVLRRGKVVSRGSVDELRRRAAQHLDVEFDGAPPEGFTALESLRDVTAEGSRVRAVVAGPIQPVLAMLAQAELISVSLPEPDLDEAFLDLYEEG